MDECFIILNCKGGQITQLNIDIANKLRNDEKLYVKLYKSNLLEKYKEYWFLDFTKFKRLIQFEEVRIGNTKINIINVINRSIKNKNITSDLLVFEVRKQLTKDINYIEELNNKIFKHPARLEKYINNA
jgi:hypothetical protein